MIIRLAEMELMATYSDNQNTSHLFGDAADCAEQASMLYQTSAHCVVRSTQAHWFVRQTAIQSLPGSRLVQGQPNRVDETCRSLSPEAEPWCQASLDQLC